MNKIFLIGNLVRDPELTETSAETQKCSVPLALNRRTIDGSKTDYYNLIAWRGLAVILSRYGKKGKKVSFVGNIEQEPYTDKKGNSSIKINVIIQDIEFLPLNEQKEQVQEPKQQFTQQTIPEQPAPIKKEAEPSQERILQEQQKQEKTKLLQELSEENSEEWEIPFK